MMTFLEAIEFWHWWVLGGALLVMEILVSGTFFLWMAIAAGIIGLLLFPFPDMGWKIQFLIFAALSVAAIASWQVWLSRHPTETDDSTLNRRGSQYVGRVVTLDEALVDGRGRVQIDGIYWTVSMADGGDVESGGRVKVTSIEGTVLRVEPA
jgi:membrane protein implicated in regulation of membrane protease activity